MKAYKKQFSDLENNECLLFDNEKTDRCKFIVNIQTEYFLRIVKEMKKWGYIPNSNVQSASYDWRFAPGHGISEGIIYTTNIKLAKKFFKFSNYIFDSII